jgi:hypothetical protein
MLKKITQYLPLLIFVPDLKSLITNITCYNNNLIACCVVTVNELIVQSVLFTPSLCVCYFLLKLHYPCAPPPQQIRQSCENLESHVNTY